MSNQRQKEEVERRGESSRLGRAQHTVNMKQKKKKSVEERQQNRKTFAKHKFLVLSVHAAVLDGGIVKNIFSRLFTF